MAGIISSDCIDEIYKVRWEGIFREEMLVPSGLDG